VKDNAISIMLALIILGWLISPETVGRYAGKTVAAFNAALKAEAP
jgi:hypothetical protein